MSREGMQLTPLLLPRSEGSGLSGADRTPPRRPSRRQTTYDPLSRTPNGRSAYDADLAQTIVNTAAAFEHPARGGQVLHYKALTEAFYTAPNGGVLAQEAYLHFMANANRQRAGSREVRVRSRRQESQHGQW